MGVELVHMLEIRFRWLLSQTRAMYCPMRFPCLRGRFRQRLLGKGLSWLSFFQSRKVHLYAFVCHEMIRSAMK